MKIRIGNKHVMKMMAVAVAAFALVLGMTQCKKHVDMITPATPEDMADVTVVIDNGGEKTDITASGVVTWKAGDKVYIVAEEQGLLGYVSAGGDGSSVTFTGRITSLKSDQVLRFYYVGNRDFMPEESGNYTFDISSQNGSLSRIATHDQLIFGMTNAAVAAGTTDFGTVSMRSLMSIAHLNITSNGSKVSSVTVTGGFSRSTFNAMTYDGTTPITGTAGDITMTFSSTAYSNDCYIALLPGEQTLTFIMYSGCRGKSIGRYTVQPNKFYNSGSAIPVTMPVFSLSSSQKVKFSRGNLYYSNSWKFEQNQYDFRTYSGNGRCVNGTYSASGSDAGWGLFGWSSTNGSNNYGMNTSTLDLTYRGSFKDWGGAEILPDNSNGTVWFTMSQAQWEYLLNTRTGTYNGSSTEAKGLRGFATIAVNGGTVKGMVLLPDTFTLPAGVAFVSSLTPGISANSYTVAQWSLMEGAGAVFLPAAGDRTGTTVTNVCSSGYYWTSTAGSSWDRAYRVAHYMNETSDEVVMEPYTRHRGYAVRLVRN